MGASTPFSLRLPKGVAEELNRIAQLSGRAPASLAARLIEKALRMRDVPGIIFVDVSHGRCAAIIGSVLFVWEMCVFLLPVVVAE